MAPNSSTAVALDLLQGQGDERKALALALLLQSANQGDSDLAKRIALSAEFAPSIRAMSILGLREKNMFSARELQRFATPNQPAQVRNAAVEIVAGLSHEERINYLILTLPTLGSETEPSVAIAILELLAGSRLHPQLESYITSLSSQEGIGNSAAWKRYVDCVRNRIKSDIFDGCSQEAH